MRNITKSTRFYERTKLVLPVEVHYIEDEKDIWTENTSTNEVTLCGVDFLLSHQVEPGRVIKLKLPMPKEMRLFDFDKPIYEVWGIVSSIQLHPTDKPDKFKTRTGVALIGKNPPANFNREPLTLYNLSSFLQKKSFWNYREIPRQRGRYSRSLENRENYGLDVIIQTLNKEGKIVETAIGRTNDISESGMALTAKFKFGCSKYVIIKNPERELFLLSKVRRISALEEDQGVKLNLEFISGKWHFR